MFTPTVARALAGRIIYLVSGGTARNVLDFAELMSAQVTGRLLLGHTVSATAPTAPIYATVIEPGGAFEADATCPTCAARSQIGALGDDTLLLVEHEPGCRWLAALEKRAGGAR